MKETNWRRIYRKMSRNKGIRFLTCVRLVLFSFHSSYKVFFICYFMGIPTRLNHIWSNCCCCLLSFLACVREKCVPKMISIAVQLHAHVYKVFASNCHLHTPTRVLRLQIIGQCGQLFLFIPVYISSFKIDIDWGQKQVRTLFICCAASTQTSSLKSVLNAPIHRSGFKQTGEDSREQL